MNVVVLVPLKYKGKTKIMKVDYDDWQKFKDLKWILNSKGYCRRHVPATNINKRKNQYFHRAILNITDSTIIIDHINRDSLDNRQANLRKTSIQINRLNSKLNSNNTSGFRGVSKNKIGTYRASLRVNNKTLNLGDYKTAEEASKVHTVNYKKYFGHII